MEIYFSDKGFENPRSHPYIYTRQGEAGFVDFRNEPDRIPSTLEDFIPFNQEPAVQIFYDFLRWLNGPESILESCDCALQAPEPHEYDFSPKQLCVHGRLMIMFRDLKLNCTAEIDDLHDIFWGTLTAQKPHLMRDRIAVGIDLSPALHRSISPVKPDNEGFLFIANDDPGLGYHLLINFQAFGDTNEEAWGNLAQLFRGLDSACRETSRQLSELLQRG